MKSLMIPGLVLLLAPMAHAGDVRAVQHGSQLNLTYDDAIGEISLTSIPTGGVDPVEGTVSVRPAVGTTLNGDDTDIDFLGVQSVRIQGGDVLNRVLISKLIIAKKLSYKGADGDDYFDLDLSSIGGDVSVQGGKAPNALNVTGTGSQVFGKLSVKGDRNNDFVHLTIDVVRGTNISLGDGADDVLLTGMFGPV